MLSTFIFKQFLYFVSVFGFFFFFSVFVFYFVATSLFPNCLLLIVVFRMVECLMLCITIEILTASMQDLQGAGHNISAATVIQLRVSKFVYVRCIILTINSIAMRNDFNFYCEFPSFFLITFI